MTPSGVLALAVALYESHVRSQLARYPGPPAWSDLHPSERRYWINQAIYQVKEEEPYVDSLLSPGSFGFKIQKVGEER